MRRAQSLSVSGGTLSLSAPAARWPNTHFMLQGPRNTSIPRAHYPSAIEATGREYESLFVSGGIGDLYLRLSETLIADFHTLRIAQVT